MSHSCYKICASLIRRRGRGRRRHGTRCTRSPVQTHRDLVGFIGSIDDIKVRVELLQLLNAECEWLTGWLVGYTPTITFVYWSHLQAAHMWCWCWMVINKVDRKLPATNFLKFISEREVNTRRRRRCRLFDWVVCVVVVVTSSRSWALLINLQIVIIWQRTNLTWPIGTPRRCPRSQSGRISFSPRLLLMSKEIVRICIINK